jgi:DNA primase
MDAYQAAKEELKRTIDIVELIGQFVQLKRSGQNYMGLCPFHSEKAPSFTVSQTKQMFHCFGCKKGGDAFAFWMEYHKVPFPDALRDLAEKYHVTLPQRQMTSSQKEEMTLKTRIFNINKAAADYFQHILTKTDEGRPGREYLAKRSIPEEIISEFKLGYAPAKWDGLIGFLNQKKMDMKTAEQAGLIVPNKKGGYYDRFRGRVIFPIEDLRQQIVGFGGRVLDDSLPKYLNSPETPVFHKGKLLFGLHTALQKIRDTGRVVIVEGYTDALALKMHNFKEVVATLGTALTENHVRTLKGYAREAVVVFDPDSAGKTAAMKSLSAFLNEGLASKVIILPEGDDPDSFVNKHGLDGFLKLLSQSIPMFDFFVDMKLSLGGDQIEGQIRALEDILPVLSQLKNEAMRSYYVRHLAEKLNIAESAVLAELNKWATSQATSQATIQTYKGKTPEYQEGRSGTRVRNQNDQYFLNLLIHHPQTMDRLMNQDFKIILSDPVILEIFDTEGDLSPADILEKLRKAPVRERFREAMLTPPIFSDDMVEQAVNGLENKVHQTKMAESSIKARQQGDLERANKILELKRSRENQVL